MFELRAKNWQVLLFVVGLAFGMGTLWEQSNRVLRGIEGLDKRLITLELKFDYMDKRVSKLETK